VIAHLRGRVLRKSPQEVIVDVAGVGYRLAIPVSTFYRLGEEGSEDSLRVHTHVREDALALFGFLTAHEQDLFERLIQVAGVGPKLAVNILSGIEAAELAAALRRSDIARLACPGGQEDGGAPRGRAEGQGCRRWRAPEAERGGAPEDAEGDDLLSALAHLGYSRAEAERGVDRALRDDGSGRFEDLLRRALQIVSGGAR
jgi:Holliday junction DNA helicase RuvA